MENWNTVGVVPGMETLKKTKIAVVGLERILKSFPCLVTKT